MNRGTKYPIPCKLQRKQELGKQHHHRYQKHYQHWQYLLSWRLVRVFPLIQWWFLVLGARQLWIQQLYHAKQRRNGLGVGISVFKPFWFQLGRFRNHSDQQLGQQPIFVGFVRCKCYNLPWWVRIGQPSFQRWYPLAYRCANRSNQPREYLPISNQFRVWFRIVHHEERMEPKEVLVLRKCVFWKSTCDMLSAPPAIPIVAFPSSISVATWATASKPEPQRRFTVRAGIETSQPARRAACLKRSKVKVTPLY